MSRMGQPCGDFSTSPASSQLLLLPPRPLSLPLLHRGHQAQLRGSQDNFFFLFSRSLSLSPCGGRPENIAFFKCQVLSYCAALNTTLRGIGVARVCSAMYKSMGPPRKRSSSLRSWDKRESNLTLLKYLAWTVGAWMEGLCPSDIDNKSNGNKRKRLSHPAQASSTALLQALCVQLLVAVGLVVRQVIPSSSLLTNTSGTM